MKTLKNFGKMAFKPLMLFAIAATLLTACKKDDINVGSSDAAALNVVNASPGPLAFNFFLDNVFVNGPAISFGSQSNYILAYTGNRKFDVTSDGTNVSLLADTLALSTDKYYSVFIVGSNTALSTFVTEDNTTDPSAGKAKIRFLQLSPDAGQLSLNVKGGTQLFASQDYKTASAYTEVDPGTITLELRGADSTVGEKEVTLQAGKIYTIWSGGLISGSGDTAINIVIAEN